MHRSSSSYNPLLLSPVVSRLLDLLHPRDFLPARLVCKLWRDVAEGCQSQWLVLMWNAGFPATCADGKVYLKLQKTVPLRVQLAKHNGKKMHKKLVKLKKGWEDHLIAVRAQEEDAVETIAKLDEKLVACDKALKQLEKTPRKRFVLVNSKLTFKKRISSNSKHGK